MNGATISLAVWSSMVERWNGRHPRERVALAAVCHERGHDLAIGPVGPFCCRCLAQFPGDGSGDGTGEPPSAYQRGYQRRRLATIKSDPDAYAAYRQRENERARDYRRRMRERGRR